MVSIQPYASNGVVISKSTICVGNKITLSYNGLLAQNGADSIFAHIGYGDEWEGKMFIPMELTDGSFNATFKVNMPGSLNISFKDSADNWDNNSTENYSFEVIKKAKASAKSDTLGIKEKAVKTKKSTGVSKDVEKNKKKSTTTELIC